MRRSVVIALLGLLIAAAPGNAASSPQLPDLYQEVPYNLQLEVYGTGPDAAYHLGFGSTVYNYGTGPLEVAGRRDSTSTPEMVASQVITNSDGTKTTIPNIGSMRYVDSITHRHWHYLGFDTYSLTPVSGGTPRPDAKTGFCLGDRIVGHDWETLPGQPSEPVFNGGCGYDDPDLLEVSEGISPNYADPYAAQVEGQFVDVTDLPAGRYVLTHHVNQNRKLQESDYSDDAASVLVSVAWPNGQDAAPKVTELARCQESAKCPLAPALTRTKATSYAKTAVRKSKAKVTGLKCPTPTGVKDTCSAKARGGKKVAVKVAYKVSRGDVYWTWSVGGGGVKSKSGSVLVPSAENKEVPTKYARTGAGKLAYCPLQRG